MSIEGQGNATKVAGNRRTEPPGVTGLGGLGDVGDLHISKFFG